MFKELFTETTKSRKSTKPKKKVFYAYIKGPGGGTDNMYKIFSNKRMRSNHSRVSLSITNLEWMLNRQDIMKEQGNIGTSQVSAYMRKRIDAAADKSKNNKAFAKNLNKEFKVNYFTSEELFESSETSETFEFNESKDLKVTAQNFKKDNNVQRIF